MIVAILNVPPGAHVATLPARVIGEHAIIGEASDANVEQIARGRVWVRIASDRVGSRRIGAMLRQAWEDKRKERRRG